MKQIRTTKKGFIEMMKKKAPEYHNKYKHDLLEALNRIDELACISAEDNDNDNGEAEQLEKDYNLIFDFINKRI